MIQTIKKGEYAVVQVAREDGRISKPQLIKVASVDKLSGDFSGRLEHNPHLKEVHLACRPQEVLANLGKSPRPGNVYGYEMSKLFLRTEEDGLHLFCEPEPADLEKLRKGIERGNSLMSKRGFKRLATACEYITEIVPKNGKYAGMYKHSGDPEKNPHRVLLSLGEKTIATASVASYTYVYLHEHCHAVHFQLLADHPNLNSQWVKLFTTSVNSNNLGKARLTELARAIVDFEGSVKDFMRSSDTEVVADVKLVFRWLLENRNLSPREIEVLKTSKSASSKETLEEVWPYTSVHSKKLKPLVTEYGCKNFRELFAESCSLHLLGKEIPAVVSALAEKSLSLANQLAASK